MRKHLKYINYLFWHKWWVFAEGIKRGLFLRVIIHDYDKLLPGRWMAYADNFYGVQSEAVKLRFREHWRQHVNINDHHWQFWVSIHDDGKVRAHEMSEKARTEMLVDWLSAHRAIGGTNLLGWYMEREATILLAPETRKWIKKELMKL